MEGELTRQTINGKRIKTSTRQIGSILRSFTKITATGAFEKVYRLSGLSPAANGWPVGASLAVLEKISCPLLASKSSMAEEIVTPLPHEVLLAHLPPTAEIKVLDGSAISCMSMTPTASRPRFWNFFLTCADCCL
jgi:hypothetical protein